MYKAQIEKALQIAVKNLGFIAPTDPLLSISEKPQFGDYSSNIALQLSKQKHKNLYQNPLEIANAIIEKMGHPEFLIRIEVAGAGFLNFFLKDEELTKVLGEEYEPDDLPAGGGEKGEPKRIIVEYCDPNTHKVLHIGHLLPLTLGETLSRLLEYQGHEVFRVNYGSDIGLTVAKCLWGIEKRKKEFEDVRVKGLREKVEFLGMIYSYAHSEYEKSLETKEEVDRITDKIYQRDPQIVPIWEETKDWSLGYFETIYSIFGTLFDRRINESEVDRLGKQIVLENIGKVFIKDEGAVIFPGKKFALHNRVFINSKGNPTYEGKEVGLASKYQEIFSADELRIFSDKAQNDYFDVVILANEMVFPHIKGKVKHYSFGSVGLTTGKMSSRSGNVVTAEELIDIVKLKIRQISPSLDELSIVLLAVGAIKFAFLKYSVNSDIVYDVEESVSIHGDTGPYVIYVYARIQSLLKKANRAKNSEAVEENVQAREEGIAQTGQLSAVSVQPSAKNKKADSRKLIAESIEPEERDVLRQLDYFEFTVHKAADNFQPNELCKYLLNLCKAFNSFYEKQPVLGSKKEEFRLKLAARTAETIKLGLYLLGIETVERM